MKYFIENDSPNAKNLRLILIPFTTLLYAFYYYITNFLWGGGVNTFKLGAIVWSASVVIGLFILLFRYLGKVPILTYAFLYLVYTLLLILLGGTTNIIATIRTCTNTSIWVALMALFFNDSYKNGVHRWFLPEVRIALPILLVAFIMLVNKLQTDSTIKTLNPVFYIFYLTPFALMEKRSLFKYPEIILIFIAIILSNKRTALIGIGLIAIYYIFREMNKKKNLFSYIRTIVFVALAILVLYYVFNKTMEHYGNIDWAQRMSDLDENGGGRTWRWERFFIDIRKSSISQYVFGHGITSPFYHNDLMQVFYNTGLIGTVFYVAFCIQLIVIFIKMARRSYEYTTAFGASLIIFFLHSSVGQVIVISEYILILGVIWGLLIGNYYRTCQIQEGENGDE